MESIQHNTAPEKRNEEAGEPQSLFRMLLQMLSLLLLTGVCLFGLWWIPVSYGLSAYVAAGCGWRGYVDTRTLISSLPIFIVPYLYCLGFSILFFMKSSQKKKKSECCRNSYRLP